VPTCPVTTFSGFRLDHRQTQLKSTVLNTSNSHQMALLTGGTISHAAKTELETQNILCSTEKLLSNVEKRKHQTTLHSAHRAMTLSDRSLEKLLKSISCQELLSEHSEHSSIYRLKSSGQQHTRT
jgi:UDP-N-acetylglucosamine 2-epimerase